MAQLAYGNLALPKLIVEICADNKCQQYQSLNALSNYLYNPLEADRAINQFELVRRLNNNFQRKLREPLENADQIEFILKIFEILASHFNGAIRMTDLCSFLSAIHNSILQHAFWDHQAARILRVLSTQPKIAFRLYSSKFRIVLTSIFQNQEYSWKLEDLLYHLSNLICINPSKFIELGFFEMLYDRISDTTLFERPTVQSNMRKFPNYTAMLKCFGLLINCKEGQETFMEVDGVHLMYMILKTNCIPDWIYEFAALALQNGTICKVTVWRSKDFWDLPLALLKCAHSKENDALQLYALKCLRNITCMSVMKKFVRNVCLPQIQDVFCRKEMNKLVKEKLVKWLKSKKYVNVEKPTEEECLETEKPNKNCICQAREFQKLINGSDSD